VICIYVQKDEQNQKPDGCATSDVVRPGFWHGERYSYAQDFDRAGNVRGAVKITGAVACCYRYWSNDKKLLLTKSRLRIPRQSLGAIE
jgi:hypothetical protein